MRLEHRLPTASEFMNLRAETDWGVPVRSVVGTLLERSFSGVVAIENERVIGMARTVGDGCVILYIQDVIVTASHRAQGVGIDLVQGLLHKAAQTCLPDCTVGLFAAVGQDGFYSKLGFSTRNNSAYGPGMHGTLSDLAKPENAA